MASTVTGNLFVDNKIPIKDIAWLQQLPISIKKTATEIVASYHAEQYEKCIKITNTELTTTASDPNLLFYIGHAALKINNIDLAYASLLTALHYKPDDTNILYWLGMCCYEQRNYEQAIHYLHQAYELNPERLVILQNLTHILYISGQHKKAEPYFLQLLKLHDTPETHFDYALQLIAEKKYKKGWHEYEYRLKKAGNKLNPLHTRAPLWQGEDIKGKTLLISTEQGLGDNILFLRFIPKLKQLTQANLIYFCPLALKQLAGSITDISQIISIEKNQPGLIIPSHHYWVPIMSLAERLNINKLSDFGTSPYLTVPHALVAKWKPALETSPKLKIGLSWAGNPKYVYDKKRSCQLNNFLFLLEYPEVAIYSLQKEISNEDRTLLACTDIKNLGTSFTDLSDTAAIIKQLDLVITIDSAIAHLAGALGTPIWALLRYETTWHHPAKAKESPWYKNMRYFRQKVSGDWDTVFAEVKEAMQEMITSNISHSSKGKKNN